MTQYQLDAYVINRFLKATIMWPLHTPLKPHSVGESETANTAY